MQQLAERIDVDRISEEARRIRFGHALLTLIAALLYGGAWLLARCCRGLWLAAAWSVTAVRLGWRDGWAVDQPVRRVGPA